MFKQVLQYFDRQKWQYQLSEGSSCIAFFGVRTQNGKFHCIVDIDEGEGKIIFLSIYPVNVPEKIRPQMSELLVRLNYVLFFGSFEMNFEDGEIRFKTSTIYADSNPTEQMIENIIQTNITTMDTHFELFNSFITEKTTITEVTKKIQSISSH